MVTKNFKNLLAAILEADLPATSGNVYAGALKMRAVDGSRKYIQSTLPSPNFPSTINRNVGYTVTSVGISFGRDGTPSSEDDYNLGDTITSGISASISSVTPSTDSLGNPQLTFVLTVTNTGNEPITIREVGYKQPILTNQLPNYASTTTHLVFLFDRTVLSPALTIESGDAGIIEYTLRTIVRTAKSIGGVTIEPFETATDENFAAMIEAARNGNLDLHDDCGWEVGDLRRIDVGAWTDSYGTNHPATTVYIVLSSFDEYENCGNVIQFDFQYGAETFKCKMNSTSTTAGGYGASSGREICSAIADAMPQYMKDLMRTFDVKASSSGGSSGQLVTVSNNKLALRSEVEVFGTADKSIAGEGSIVELYKDTLYKDDGVAYYRRKKTIISGSVSGAISWLRSTNTVNSSYWIIINQNGESGTGQANVASNMFAPFGCL